MAASSEPQRRSVIGRVSQILSAFDRHNRSMPLTSLAYRADLPVPTTYRLVTELTRYGLLERDEDKNIRIGLRLWELSARGSDTLSLRDIAFPYIEDLHNHLEQMVSLAVLSHGTVLYLERLAPEDFDVDRAHVAQRHPLHAASSGLVLLAFSSPEYQDEFLGRRLPRYTENTITDPVILRRMLSEIRKERQCTVADIGTSGWTGIAVPVFGVGNEFRAALNVTIRTGAEHPAKFLPALRATAFSISLALGASPKDKKN